MFWDTAEVETIAGRGGDGLLNFLHEKYRENGGPDGGDGGNGGSVWFESSASENTLHYFRNHRLLRAEDGERGKQRKQHGRSGEDLIIPVPVGTVVKNASDELLADLGEAGDRYQVARGGRGGFGNAHFLSSTRQAPDITELGEKGQRLDVHLELKLVADVGFIGLPNAGKSTLLAHISAAKPKIAAYAFTTTTPNLGVVEERGFHFVACDIPGLIEGASQGKGLGHEFLRHVERCRVLVHLVDGTSDNLDRDYKTIRAELEKFDTELSKKPEIVVINKIDMPEAASAKLKKPRADARISAVSGEGVAELLGAIAEKLAKLPVPVKAESEPARRRYTPESNPNLFLVEKKGSGYRVSGGKIEKFAQRLDLSQASSQRRIRDIMGKMGVTNELLRHGAKEGDTIILGEQHLPFRQTVRKRPKY
jgi:GTP-binding protein